MYLLHVKIPHNFLSDKNPCVSFGPWYNTEISEWAGKARKSNNDQPLTFPAGWDAFLAQPLDNNICCLRFAFRAWTVPPLPKWSIVGVENTAWPLTKIHTLGCLSVNIPTRISYNPGKSAPIVEASLDHLNTAGLALVHSMFHGTSSPGCETPAEGGPASVPDFQIHRAHKELNIKRCKRKKKKRE